MKTWFCLGIGLLLAFCASRVVAQQAEEPDPPADGLRIVVLVLMRWSDFAAIAD